MTVINVESLVEQLQCVDASYDYLIRQVRAADGKAVALHSDEHRALMEEIVKARQEYIAELVTLSFTLRVQLEKTGQIGNLAAED